METLRYQTIEIDRGIGESGYAEEPVTLDKSYGKVTGVRAYLVADGGQAYIKIGLKDRNYMLHNASPNADWAPNVDYFYKPLNIRHHGQDFFVITDLPAANAAALKLILVFRLEKE